MIAGKVWILEVLSKRTGGGISVDKGGVFPLLTFQLLRISDPSVRKSGKSVKSLKVAIFKW